MHVNMHEAGCIVTTVNHTLTQQILHAFNFAVIHLCPMYCNITLFGSRLIVEWSDLRALLGQLFVWAVHGHPEMEMKCSPQHYSNNNNFESYTHGRGSG